ncbi:SDR family oxidoreductase [Flavobacterium zepuense]|uniref:SDR family oxidoreductase n=1 Tax=Flavobacterium zepuense TaxID=2593302 RepID=A0A552UVG1_9FLAO|nr:SDR family oxidoreductase [Flavobacterium zepuense]TRW22224.1 SDR family oxidoreductase [Flavobacterium zepuense]
MQSEIKGKVVAITGASSGIGKAIALTLAQHGAKVVLGARRATQLQEITNQIIADGGEAAFAETDVTIKTDLTHLVNVAVEKFGRLDVMINNAGVAQLSRIDELDIDGWDQMIDINLKGVLYGMAAALPVLKENRGHIVNIISTAGLKITPTMGVYAGTKNAVRTIAEAFRQESDGTVRITGISPGVVQTGFVNNLKNEQIKTTVQNNMAEFGISPNAIANAVVYAICQPAGVEVGDIVIRPASQN